MTARVDWLLPRVAEELGLELLGPLGGGEFGAALVHDPNRDVDAVLKAVPATEMAPVWARGVDLSQRLRARGYPVPEYYGSGVSAADATWSLQSRMPGEIPDVMTETFARQLLSLAERHRDAADRPGDVLDRLKKQLGDSIAALEANPKTASLGRDIARTLEANQDAPVRTGDVVHGDFHHRNYLAIDDEVTAVFDWELAWAGDARCDLVVFASWSSWLPTQIPPPVASIIVDAAEDACEPDVLALFAAAHMGNAVGFYSAVHPELLDWVVPAIDATTRRWLSR